MEIGNGDFERVGQGIEPKRAIVDYSADDLDFREAEQAVRDQLAAADLIGEVGAATSPEIGLVPRTAGELATNAANGENGPDQFSEPERPEPRKGTAGRPSTKHRDDGVTVRRDGTMTLGTRSVKDIPLPDENVPKVPEEDHNDRPTPPDAPDRPGERNAPEPQKETDERQSDEAESDEGKEAKGGKGTRGGRTMKPAAARRFVVAHTEDVRIFLREVGDMRRAYADSVGMDQAAAERFWAERVAPARASLMERSLHPYDAVDGVEQIAYLADMARAAGLGSDVIDKFVEAARVYRANIEEVHRERTVTPWFPAQQ